MDIQSRWFIAGPLDVIYTFETASKYIKIILAKSKKANSNMARDRQPDDLEWEGRISIDSTMAINVSSELQTLCPEPWALGRVVWPGKNYFT